jgi:3-oxoacyl-[acyl-carrier protein] reductase
MVGERLGNSGLEGKAALVTGASKGIGGAAALGLSEMGVKVAVNYNTSAENAQELVTCIEDRGGEAFAVQADVSRLDQVTSMVNRVNETWGGVDILVNNAGIIKDNLLARMTDEQWDHVLGTNLNGAFYCTRAVLRDMLRKRWGRIISIGSIVGLRGNPGQVNYAASKAGLNGFTIALAKEVASRNITVNTIAPGYINTDTVGVLPQKLKDQILSLIPGGHFGEVEDIAHMVTFLASERGRYITGQIIGIDGGLAL